MEIAARTLVVRCPGVAAHALSFVLGSRSSLRVCVGLGVVSGFVVVALDVPVY